MTNLITDKIENLKNEILSLSEEGKSLTLIIKQITWDRLMKNKQFRNAYKARKHRLLNKRQRLKVIKMWKGRK